ncbi:MAG: hemin receptor [Bergeyella zoohelcum]|nr:hemin receptor [Bergeyella zoohelcum]
MTNFKKIILAGTLSISGFYFAQDVSVIRNTLDVYSNDHSNGTAKNMAMAGSMGALGGDLSAIATNPAAAGVFISGTWSATLSVNSSKTSSKHANNTLNYDNTLTKLGQIGGMLSFDPSDVNSKWKMVNLAFNYSNTSIDDYIETPGNHNIYLTRYAENPSTGTIGIQDLTDYKYNGHAYNRYGNKSNLNIALGANYDHKVYIGGALNFKSVDIEQGDVFQLLNTSLDSTTGLPVNILGTFGKQYTPYTENSTGFSASVGAIGKINNNFRVGVSIETPTFWSIDRTYTDYYLDSANNWSSDVYNENVRLTTPFKTTLSLGLVANKNFALNVDYTQALSTPKYKTDSGADSQLNDYFSNSYKKESEIRVGGEYRVNAFRLRAGYAYRNSPLKSETLSVAPINGGEESATNIANPYLGSRQILSGGIGYDFKSFYIDAAIQNVTTKFDNAFGAGEYGSVSSDYGFDSVKSITSSVKQRNNNFLLTFGWKF